jgi:hypothetical protein
MTELTTTTFFPEGGGHTWTTATQVLHDDGVGPMSARTINLITGSLAEVGLLVPRGDGDFDSLVSADQLAQALALVRAVVRLDTTLPRD